MNKITTKNDELHIQPDYIDLNKVNLDKHTFNNTNNIKTIFLNFNKKENIDLSDIILKNDNDKINIINNLVKKIKN